nr:JHL06P13.17 [Jatropha curcas]
MKNNNSSFPSQYRNYSTSSEAKDDVVHSLNKEDRSSVVTENKPVAQKLESKPSMDINESAEAFIKNFRHQLLIQRLESIENYEQMLARGL